MNSSRSRHILFRKRVSIITKLQLQINRYKRENDKQKCLLMILFYFYSWKLHFILRFISLHINFIKFIWTIKRFTTRSSKLKVHRANSQTTSSYPVRFSSDILFSFLVSFAFFVFLFSFFVFVLKLKIYILIHIRLTRRWLIKKLSHGLI